MRSGFCGLGNPDDSHARCRMPECHCDCHEARAESDPHPGQLLARAERRLDNVISDLLYLSEQAGASALRTVSEMPGDDALRSLYALRQVTTMLGQIDAALVQRIYLAGEHGDVRLDGLPAAKVQRGRDRKDWDARGAAFAYLDARMRERDGELPDPAEVVDWVLEVAGIGYMRVTPLRAHGLEPRDYCTESPGKIGVTFSD